LPDSIGPACHGARGGRFAFDHLGSVVDVFGGVGKLDDQPGGVTPRADGVVDEPLKLFR
jgi:hypothetical protein